MLNDQINKTGLLTITEMVNLISTIDRIPCNIIDLYNFFNKYTYNLLDNSVQLLIELNLIIRKDDGILTTNKIDFNTATFNVIANRLLEYIIVSSPDFFQFSYIDDENQSMYFIPIKYHMLRNILLEADLIKSVNSNLYVIDNFYDSLFVQLHKKKNRQMSLEELKRKLELQEIIGEKAELFVIDYEKKKFPNRKINYISPIDVSAGYDIKSYIDITSTTSDKLIEVKCIDKEGNFFISRNELLTAKLYPECYYLYLVDSSFTHPPIEIDDVFTKLNNSDRYSIEKIKVNINKITER